MVYNIMAKSKRLPEKSEAGQQMLKELTSIGESCQGMSLLTSLEDYSVLWIKNNLREGQPRGKARLEQLLLSSDQYRRNAETPKKRSRSRNKTCELNKTVKNSRGDL
jgi:hypothetical protein